MIVKVCGITRREDAETAVEAGPSALGFVFFPNSPRFVTAEQAAALGRDLPIWKVGVFVDETAASIGAVIRAARLDIAQIYGGEALAGVRVWEAHRVVGQVANLRRVANPPSEKSGAKRARRGGVAAVWSGPPRRTLCAEAVLLDSLSNGQRFDWALARGVAEKVIVAGGLNAANVAEAIRAAQPWGVDASSGLESSPGVKDRDKVRQFVEAALSA